MENRCKAMIAIIDLCDSENPKNSVAIPSVALKAATGESR